MKQLLITLCCLFCLTGFTQTTDSSAVVKDSTAKKLPKDPRPRNAALLSTIIPGAGQIYNRKYWKAPIVWGGMGAFGYYFIKNQKLYSKYRDSLVQAVEVNTSTNAIDYYQKQKVIYRKYRDLLAFGVIAVYVMQIIDANVDAHLKTFDVSDDLSLRVGAKPVLTGNAWGAGISFKLNFK